MYKSNLLLLQTMVLGMFMYLPILHAGDVTSSQSYREALREMQSHQADSGKSRFSAEDRAVMEHSATALTQRMPDPGIKTGEHAPDFSLPNAYGKSVNLKRQLEHGPVILVFYRGAWCPFCNLHLRLLQENLAEFEHYGASLIAITPQKPDQSAAQIRKSGYPFEVLSDLDNRVMQAYRLYFEVDPALAAVYKKHGLDLSEYNGVGRNVLPVPGTFVIDRSSIVRAMHADTDYRQRMEPADIIAALQKIASHP